MKFSSEKVAVLMSTFNGVNYIKEQIDSLLKQSCPVDIHIRDDGSTDEMLSYLKSVSKLNGNIFLYQGKNVGVINSFIWLVENVSGYDYYAFCDQDDVWEPLKLSSALNRLMKLNKMTPLLYCSSFEYVDQDLRTIGFFKSKSDLSINNLLIENCAPGCTMVFNDSLRSLFSRFNIKDASQRVVMHDWFFLLLARCYGDVLYDENSYLLYRQHENNVVGIKNGVFSILKKRLARYRKERVRPNHLLFVQSSLLKELFDTEHPSANASVVVDAFIKYNGNFLSRLIYLFKKDTDKVKRVKKFDGFIFLCLFLFGYYK